MDKKILLAVNGTLMRGLKLNGNMIEAGAEFVKEAKTENIIVAGVSRMTTRR